MEEITIDLKGRVANQRTHFESFYRYLKNSKDFETLPLRELLWKVYSQALMDSGMYYSEISEEEVKKMVEEATFIDFIQDCLLHPSENPLPQNDYVKVTRVCTPEDRANCLAYPDRCTDVGGDGEHCTAIINLSKLCGVDTTKNEKIDDKILTAEEIKLINEALKEE